MAKALVIYCSKSGHTKRMAEAVAMGIESAQVSVTLLDVQRANIDDLLEANAVVLGSPCYYGTMSAEMKAFLDASVKYHGKLAGKVGGAFASSGMLGGGNETTVLSLLAALLIHGMIVEGHARIGHYGPVAVGDPDEHTLEECRIYGKQLGELARRCGSN
jgi:NAD(P)H dehydrogenase (quinone)